MENIEAGVRKVLIGDVVESLIRFGLIATLLFLCIRYFSPFADLVVWALILAIALSPAHLMLAKKFNGKMGRAATVIVLIGVLGIGAPTVMLGLSVVEPMNDLQTSIKNDELKIPPPAESVAEWPIVGKKVYGVWSEASTNLTQFVQNNKERLRDFVRKMVGVLSSTAGAVFSLIASLVIAGIMMAYTHDANTAFNRIFARVTDPIRGPKLKTLCIATVRSVAVGVIGVAFIQAVLFAVGFVWADIAIAGILTLLVFFIGILQLPALLISIPVIAFVWSGDADTTHNILITIYLVVAGFSDAVLKPLLLGRGVDVPMAVILIGALGGMITSGLIGLFVGGVVLAVGYQLFMEWVNTQDEPETAVADAK